MDPHALIKVYPWLDHMMAETLCKAHEKGTLGVYLKDWPDQMLQPVGSQVIAGAVTVEPPQEKCSAKE
jgi:hypothetical protein